MDGTAGPTATTAGALELEGFTELHAVATGGDSIIYRAHQPALERDVAIKVVSLTGEAELRRFQREIALTVRLGRAHPNIVTVLDTRTLPDGRPAIVMDFFELGSTHDRLRSTGPFPAEDVIALGRVIADALAFAHDQRVVHRDVKPQNILILPTSWVLADFGIARSVDAGHTASLERLSYRHASPEVLDGRAPEPVDDLWSLCSTLATLLEGRAPFAADDPDDDTALAYLRRVRTAQRRPLPVSAPPGLIELIEQGMHPERSRRFGSAREVMDRLRDLERGTTTGWAPGPAAGTPVAPPVPLLGPPVGASAPDAGSTSPRSTVPAREAPVTPVEGSTTAAGAGATVGSAVGGPVSATAAPAPAPAEPAAEPQQDAAVGDLPPGSEDLAWAPGAVPRARTAPSAAPPSAVPDPPQTVAALPAATSRPSADRDTDSRISTGHARPTATEPEAPALSLAGSLAGTLPSTRTSTQPSTQPTTQPSTQSSTQPSTQPSTRPVTGADEAAGPGDARTDDDARPTGWRPPAAEPADATTDGPDGVRPGVRARIIVLAAVMLLASGVVAYFVTRPAPRTPVEQIPVNNGVTAGVPVSGRQISQNDPDYIPQILSVKFDGDDLIRVVVRGPQAENASLILLDATSSELRPLGAPQTKQSEGDTTLLATVSFPDCRDVQIAVMGLDNDRKAGISPYYRVRSPGVCTTGSR